MSLAVQSKCWLDQTQCFFPISKAVSPSLSWGHSLSGQLVGAPLSQSATFCATPPPSFTKKEKKQKEKFEDFGLAFTLRQIKFHPMLVSFRFNRLCFTRVIQVTVGRCF